MGGNRQVRAMVWLRSFAAPVLSGVRAWQYRLWEAWDRWRVWQARAGEVLRGWAREAAWVGLTLVGPALGVFILLAETGLLVYPGAPRRLYGLADYGLAQAWFCDREKQLYRLACVLYRLGASDYQALLRKFRDKAPGEEFHKVVWHLVALTTLGLAVDAAEAWGLWVGLRVGLKWFRRQARAGRARRRRRQALREALEAPPGDLERFDPGRVEALWEWLFEAKAPVPKRWWSHAAGLVLAVLLRHRELPASTERGKFHDADRGGLLRHSLETLGHAVERIGRVYRDDREGRVLVAVALGHDLGKVVAHREQGGRIYMTGGHEVYSAQLLTWAFQADPELRRHADLWGTALAVLVEARRPAVPESIGRSAPWPDRVRYVLGSDRAAIRATSPTHPPAGPTRVEMPLGPEITPADLPPVGVFAKAAGADSPGGRSRTPASERPSTGPVDPEGRLLQALAEAIVIDVRGTPAGRAVRVWSVMSAFDRILFLVLPLAELRRFRPTGADIPWEDLLLRHRLLARFGRPTEGRFVRLSELVPRMAVDTGFHVFDVRLGEVEIRQCVLIPRRAFGALGPALTEKVARREGVSGPADSLHPIRHVGLRVPAADGGPLEVHDHGHESPSGKT